MALWFDGLLDQIAPLGQRRLLQPDEDGPSLSDVELN